MKIIMMTALGFISSAVALDCGSSAGTQPHAMSATEHETAASQEQQSAEAHGAQYDAQASMAETRCNPSESGSDVCWTSEMNATAKHARDAERHRELGAQHRAASVALRTAEASACSEVAAADRDTSPFAHREDVRSVSPLREKVLLGKAISYRMVGAEVTFHAVPGLTAEWLPRIVDCHLARNAAIGHATASSEMVDCPLTLRGAQASARSADDGFIVSIRADETATSEEIVRRAEFLRTLSSAAKWGAYETTRVESPARRGARAREGDSDPDQPHATGTIRSTHVTEPVTNNLSAMA